MEGFYIVVFYVVGMVTLLSWTTMAQASVIELGLLAADEYVWIYTETPRWWTASGKSEKLPQEYIQAVLRAKQAK